MHGALYLLLSLKYSIEPFMCFISSRRRILSIDTFFHINRSIYVKQSYTKLNQPKQEKNPLTPLKRECMLTLLVIFHHQEMTRLSPVLVERLDKKPELLQQVEAQAKTKSVAPFMSAYVTAYIK